MVVFANAPPPRNNVATCLCLFPKDLTCAIQFSFVIYNELPSTRLDRYRFHVFGITRPGIEPGLLALVAHAQPTVPLTRSDTIHHIDIDIKLLSTARL